jgi:hypothetical protein
MDIVTAAQLRSLVSTDGDRCVSIYMPTHPAGREGMQDAPRLKNLVTQAEQRLIEAGMRGVAAREFLNPILELPRQARWQRRGQGLAIFRSDDRLVDYCLSASLPEALIVARRFHVKSLLPAVSEPLQFFLLAISRNQVRLLKATHQGFERLSPPGLPINMRQALNLQGADRGEQVHSGMRGALGKEAGVFHGQGGRRDTLKQEVVEYFRTIDHSVRQVLAEAPWPLFLVGVEYELAIFREISSYRRIADEQLCGGFDHLNERALYAQVLPLAQRGVEQPRREAIARYTALADTNLASDDIKEIVPAAHEGRIDMLLVDPRQEAFGRYDVGTNRFEFANKPDPSLDLIELTIAQAVLRDAKVYAVGDELAYATPLRAVFRY